MNLICDCHFDGVDFLSAYCHTTNCQLKEIWEIRIVRFHIYSSQIDIRTDLWQCEVWQCTDYSMIEWNHIS